MMEVHEDGRSVVSTGTREEMERDVQAMHEYGLWATMQKRGRPAVSGFRRHRRSGASVATFTAFEADLLRSLAAQLIELLRNEAATPTTGRDPLEELLDFSGPDDRARGPGAGAAVPHGVPRRRGGGRRLPPLHREHACATARPAPPARSSTTSRRPGCRPSPRTASSSTSSSTRPHAMTWMRSFTDMRLAIATRLGVEDGDEEYWYALPDDDPRAQVHDIYDWLGFLQETLVQSAALTSYAGPRRARLRWTAC